MICKQLFDDYSISGGDELASRIALLQQKRLLNSDVIKLMRFIKDDGNKAAHKHQYEITMDQYREMSAESTRNFCDLIEALNSTLRSDFSTYSFESKVASYLEKLSYKALIDDDKEAKFKVGTALIEQVITRWNETKSTAPAIQHDDGKIARGVKLIREAADYCYIDAMYEYGLMLYSGQFVEKDIETAMGYLYTAASWGDNYAKAYFGYIAIEENITEEIRCGIDLLKESAEALNPLALTQLSVLYALGEHVELDIDKSNKLLEQAVSQDFPAAVFQLGILKFQANELELSEELLKKSKELGHWPASLTLAKIYASKTEEYHQQAKSEYRQYLGLCESNGIDNLEIRFEYAQFNFSLGGDNFKSFEEYLTLLVGIYQHKGCSEKLATRIESITPSVMKKFHLLLMSTNQTVEKKTLLLYFRPNGKPYKTQTEVSNNVLDIAKNPSLAIIKVYGAHPSHIKQQAQIEKTKELNQQESIKRQKDKSKRRKATKQKSKPKKKKK